MIKKGDIVLHSLSGLYYRCENKMMEKWMNQNKFYIFVENPDLPVAYFINSSKK